MFADLLAYPDLDRYNLSSMRVAISGGASIPAPVLDAFEDRLGLVILEGYGMTETAATMTFNPSAEERRAYSVGKPIWGTQTQVWDDDGCPLPPGPEHVGEIVTRGLHVMKGYLNQPEATAAAFTGDWVHTGDLGYFDEDGYFYFVDRKKDIVRRGGENISSVEIETVMRTFPGVGDVAIVGRPDPVLGERVVAFVVPGDEGPPDEEGLKDHVGRHLASFKVPEAVYLIDELPRTATGKIIKKQLRESLPEAKPADA
jgi:long-chain acyl-CoA synthetase